MRSCRAWREERVRHRGRLLRVSRTPLFSLGAILVAWAFTGCATPPAANRGHVSQAVEARFGQSIDPNGPNLTSVIVPGSLRGGAPLAEEQAVVLALWNNARFHESLVELDLTRADLVQAGATEPGVCVLLAGRGQAVQVPHRLPH